MPINPTTKVSASTYQQCDGTNFTTAGVENSYSVGNGSIGVYAGVGMTFDGRPATAIVDLKGSVPYGSAGNVSFSGGYRIRNNVGENSQTVQFRAQPCTVTVPVGQSTNVYATPYVAAKTDYKTGNTQTSVGGYAGVSQKIGKNTTIFVEGQIYDSKKIDHSTTSINAGISITI